jgi:hypothetical protein
MFHDLISQKKLLSTKGYRLLPLLTRMVMYITWLAIHTIEDFERYKVSINLQSKVRFFMLFVSHKFTANQEVGLLIKSSGEASVFYSYRCTQPVGSVTG